MQLVGFSGHQRPGAVAAGSMERDELAWGCPGHQKLGGAGMMERGSTGVGLPRSLVATAAGWRESDGVGLCLLIRVLEQRMLGYMIWWGSWSPRALCEDVGDYSGHQCKRVAGASGTRVSLT